MKSAGSKGSRRERGLCCSCNEPPLPGGSRCAKHAEEFRLYCQKRRDKLKEDTGSTQPGFDSKKYDHDRYAAKVAAGDCPTRKCTNKRCTESVYCQKHLDEQRAKQKELAERKATVKQAEQATQKSSWKKQGLCLDCGEKRFSKWRCRRCKALYLVKKKGWTRHDARKSVNLCQYCDHVVEKPGSARCDTCAGNKRQKFADDKAAGVCTRCGELNDNLDSDRLCVTCIEHERENYRARIDTRATANLCTGCGKKPPVENDHRCAGCAKRDRKKDRRKNKKLRNEVIEAYGGVCQCPGCSQTRHEFLHLDHVNNDGKAHRVALHGKNGGNVYTWLRRNGFPKEGFQLLCANCNLGKARHGGKCPYEGIVH